MSPAVPNETAPSGDWKVVPFTTWSTGPIGMAMPLPFRLTDCGLSDALSVSTSMPGREPVWPGVNATVTVHVELNETGPPVQVSFETE